MKSWVEKNFRSDKDIHHTLDVASTALLRLAVALTAAAVVFSFVTR